MKLLRIFLWMAGLAVWMSLAMGVRCWNWPQVFTGGQTYFIDADCYSRMTRVQMVMTHPWQPIRTHAFENAPMGTIPHTTAPMDLAIAGLALALKPVSWHAVEMAGAFVSPLLGMLLVGFLAWWGWKKRLPYRWAMTGLACFSPLLVHGFLLGRPDHQSLILLLIGVAWAAELTLWERPSRGWHIVSGVVWGLALWTSLFEPLILLALALAGRAVMVGWRSLSTLPAVASFVVIAGGGLLFDGWRFRPPTAEEADLFWRWAGNIGELRRASLEQLCAWTGWLLPVAPALLLYRAARRKERVAALLAALLVILGGLSLWQMRWGYFLILAFALALPWILGAIRWRWAAWLLFTASLWPVAREWDRQVFPDEERQAILAEEQADRILLKETAKALVSFKPPILLAPWWLSPALAYWSGGYCVGGSSHQSLPGNVDTARFYLATDMTEAADILKKRHVEYVVAYEPGRVISNSAQILGQPAPAHPLAELLYNHPGLAPKFLNLVYENQYFKVYEVR